MTTNQSLKEFLLERELDMQKHEKAKSYCFSMYDKIYRHINSCLSKKNYEGLLELLPFFEDPDSYPQFYHSAETRKVYILLNFLKLELKYEKEPFLSTVNDFNGFLDQYLLTVFAMRRLELALSEPAMAEANTYLTSIPLNIHAARIIAENEYFENFGNLYWNLYVCMKSFWSMDDKIYWLICLLKKESLQRAVLELSSLYLEIQDYPNAYRQLITIPSPSEEITTLISSLKELLPNE